MRTVAMKIVRLHPRKLREVVKHALAQAEKWDISQKEIVKPSVAKALPALGKVLLSEPDLPVPRSFSAEHIVEAYKIILQKNLSMTRVLANRKRSPTASVSSSSQAKEVVDVTSNKSKIDHDEYFELILEQQVKNRVLVRPSTHRPRLWRHKSKTFPSLIVFAAVDGGVRLASPGILWCIDDRNNEVVLIASLGWCSYKKNFRSHKVSPSGLFMPLYATWITWGSHSASPKSLKCIFTLSF